MGCINSTRPRRPGRGVNALCFVVHDVNRVVCIRSLSLWTLSLSRVGVFVHLQMGHDIRKHVYMNRDLAERLETTCERHDTSESKYLREALRQKLQREELDQ